MKEEIIAKRYADAFMAYAKDNIGIPRAAEELKKIKIILAENQDFLDFLYNLEIIYPDKCAFIDKVLYDFSDQTRTFIKLLLEKGRIRNFLDIADYARVNYYHGESIEGLLKTSYPLADASIRAIKEKLEDKFKRKINLHIEVDGNLLGGVQVSVGNTIIDGSNRKRLDELRDKLMAVRV